MNRSNPGGPRITVGDWVRDIPGVDPDALLALAKRAIRVPRPPPVLSRARYERSLVTFIDLLGFRQFVGKYSAREIAQALSIFYYSGKEVMRGDQIRTYAFSDSIVRVRKVMRSTGSPTDDRDDHSPVTAELRDLARIQFELSCWYGLFLRGGISYGDVYARSGMVFGQALIDAYELENTYSIYPRILVDPKLLSDLRTDSALWPRKNQAYTGPPTEGEAITWSLGSCLMKDKQGHVFLDYLTPEIKGATLDYILQHKHLIEHSYDSSGTPRVQDKYTWLAHYHNYAITTDPRFYRDRTPRGQPICV